MVNIPSDLRKNKETIIGNMDLSECVCLFLGLILALGVLYYIRVVLGYKRIVIAAFIAGIFLSCGSVNNPEKKYHMEFVMPDIRLCNDFGLLLIENYDILAKQTERKNSQIVYIKESENIIDLLTIMGATNSSLELMNVKIMKDLRNKINRAVNCDNANIEKTLKAAEKQLNDIELIDETVGLESLPETLSEIARLRYENPDISLKDLGQMIKPPISRSGVNHRLVRLAEVADKIRNGKY